MSITRAKNWKAVLLPVIAAALLAAGGCEPGDKADTMSDQGLVDPDGEYSVPLDNEFDQDVPE